MNELLGTLAIYMNKLNLFLGTPAGIKILNVAFISSVLLIGLLTVSLLLKQETLILLSVLLTTAAGTGIFFLSLYKPPLPDKYISIENFLVLTGLKTVEEPGAHITLGTGPTESEALAKALDSAFSKALGTTREGIYLKIREMNFNWFEKRFKTYFKVLKHKKTSGEDIVEIKWFLPSVRTFLLRTGFSPYPATLVLNFSTNPFRVPKETIESQVLLLYKTKSLYFQNGVFYATCEAIASEIARMQFKTTVENILLKNIGYVEKDSPKKEKICTLMVEPVILK